jgi:hypothetical protein
MSRKKAILGAVISLVVVCSSYYFYLEYKNEKAQDLYNKQELFVQEFTDNFISYHGGNITALDAYKTLTGVSNYTEDVESRPTTVFNLLEKVLKDREEADNMEYGQAPGVHPDGDEPALVYNDEDYNSVDYLVSLPMDEDIYLTYSSDGVVQEAFFDPSSRDIRFEYEEVLFGGTYHQIFRKNMLFSYADLQKQTMYNSLKQTDKGKVIDESWFSRLTSLTDTGFLIGFKFEDADCVAISITEYK